MPFSKGSDLESQRCLFLWWAGNRGLNPQRWFLGNYNEICPAGLWNSKKKKKHSFKIHKHVCKPEVTFIKLTCDFRGFCDNLQLCFSSHKYKLSLSFWYSVQKLVCPKSLTNTFWSLSAVLLLCNCIFFFLCTQKSLTAARVTEWTAAGALTSLLHIHPHKAVQRRDSTITLPFSIYLFIPQPSPPVTYTNLLGIIYLTVAGSQTTPKTNQPRQTRS